MYGNALDGIVEKYGVSAPKARLGQALFLIAYAFGCEFWAPWYVHYFVGPFVL